MTIYEGRNVVLRNALSKEALFAFQRCLESSTVKNEETTSNGSSQKEVLVRSLLASDWVTTFELKMLRNNDSISLIDDNAHSILLDENSFIQEMCRYSTEVEKSFEKSLNSSFEGTSNIQVFSTIGHRFGR